MKEMNEIKNKNMPYQVRLVMAAKIRDMKLVAKSEKLNKYKDIDYSVEVFNNTSLLRNPDKIGITVYYPTVEEPTHMLIGIYNLDIGEKGFRKEVKELYKTLLKKVG